MTWACLITMLRLATSDRMLRGEEETRSRRLVRRITISIPISLHFTRKSSRMSTFRALKILDKTSNVLHPKAWRCRGSSSRTRRGWDSWKWKSRKSAMTHSNKNLLLNRRRLSWTKPDQTKLSTEYLIHSILLVTPKGYHLVGSPWNTSIPKCISTAAAIQ